MERCKVLKKKEGSFKIEFNGLTQGEVQALSNALNLWASISPVAKDVKAYLRNGFSNMNDSKVKQELIENIDDELSYQVK